MSLDRVTRGVIVYLAGLAGFLLGLGLNMAGNASCAAPLILAFAGGAVGLFISGVFAGPIGRYIERDDAERQRKFMDSPEGKALQADLDALLRMPTEEAREQALELLKRTPTRLARGPKPPEIASLPCGVGEVFSLYDEIILGEYHEWIALRAMENKNIDGRDVTRIGGGETGDFAIDHGPPARIIICAHRMPPLEIGLEFPSIYHLLLHYGDAGQPHICPKCNYSLEGLDAPRRCPECGGPIMDLD